MLKHDPKAMFIQTGVFAKKWRLDAGRRGVSGVFKNAEYEALLKQQLDTPVRVILNSGDGRACWMFHGRFYWETEGLKPNEVKALLMSKERRKARTIERALAEQQGIESGSRRSRRERIPQSIQNEVWNRDGGRCVECGSRERLEYDHIVPVARGGSNTARNLQLLCESCNRAKGTGGLQDFGAGSTAKVRRGKGQGAKDSTTAVHESAGVAPGSLRIPDEILCLKGASRYDNIVRLFMQSGLRSATIVVPGAAYGALVTNLQNAVARSGAPVTVAWPAGKKCTLSRTD